jgi:hypothetical protein
MKKKVKPIYKTDKYGLNYNTNESLSDNDKKVLSDLLNLLTYDDLAEDEKIESCVKYIKDLFNK